MANTSAVWQQAAHTTYQLSSSCSARAIQKRPQNYKLKNVGEFTGKKSGEWTTSRNLTGQKEQENSAEK